MCWLIRLLLVTIVVVLPGCRTCVEERPTGCPIEIDNVYANPQFSHRKVVNVLVLPLENPMQITDFELHKDEITLSILRNFGKFHYFNIHFDHHFDELADEVINLDTGRVNRLQLGALGEEYNVDAVLKVSVNDYRAFPPMRMRIKAAILHTETAERVWGFDHVFDSDDANVVNDMRVWWNSNIAGGDMVRNRFDLATVRPSFFQEYVFNRMARSYGLARVENVMEMEQQQMKEEAFQQQWQRLQNGQK